MPKFNPFKFKVIETVYNGWHFRSRLEARWAMFFDNLDIKYDYEKEGFDLEGQWYLPDFWLSDLECWVEIKGQEPTEEEQNKARLLALYTSYPVHIIYGNIGSPNNKNTHHILTYYPPLLSAETKEEYAAERRFQQIPASGQVLGILKQLHSVGITAYVNDECFLMLRQEEFCATQEDLTNFANTIQQQYETIQRIAPFLREHEQDLIAALSIDDEWRIEFSPGFEFEDLVWVECSDCGGIDIGDQHAHIGCLKSAEHFNSPRYDSPRLIAAYDAARQARF